MENRFNRKLLSVSVAVATALSAGCSMQQADNGEENARKYTELSEKLSGKHLYREAASNDDLIVENKGLYLAATAIDSNQEADVPDFLNNPFSMSTRFKVSMFDIMDTMSEDTGVEIEFTPDAYAYISNLGDSAAENARSSDFSSGGGSEASALPSDDSTTMASPLQGSENFANILQSYMDADVDVDAENTDSLAKKLLAEKLFRAVDYKGTLAGFMDNMTASTGLSWAYDDDKVVISRYVTQTYLVDPFPGSVGLSSTISNSSSDEGKASSDSNEYSAELDIWADLEATLENMRSEGGTFNISQAAGTITITDIPSVTKNMGKHIKRINELMGTRFMVSTEVLEIEIDDNDSLGIDWDLAYSRMAAMSAVSNPATMAATLTAQGVDPSIGQGLLDDWGTQQATNYLTEYFQTGGRNLLDLSSNDLSSFSATVMDGNNRFQNSKMLIKALHEQGRVSVKTTATAVTSHGRAAPIHVLNEDTYLAEITVERNDDGSESVTLNPDTVKHGLSLNVIPKLMDNGNIMMHYNLDITTLQSMSEYGIGENTIQMPQTKTQNFLQRVPIKAGDKLLLAGFEQTSDSFTYTGKAKRNSVGPLGGSQNGGTKRVITLIIVTPHLVK